MSNILIGYQIVSNDGKNNIPEEFYSFEIFKDIIMVENWIRWEKHSEKNGFFKWVILPIFEGDIEEPTFIKKINK